MVKVRCFAVMKTVLGQEEVLLPVGPDETLGTVLRRLEENRPGLSEFMGSHPVLIAINGELAHREDLVQDGDEIALLPPFSGGGAGVGR